MSRAIKIFLLPAVTLFLAGCGNVPHRVGIRLSDHFPPQYELDSVPFYAQKAHQCGPAALAMVMAWGGITMDPEMLLSEVFTPSRRGSLQFDLIGAARRHGRIAYPISNLNALLAEVAAGHPVIVLQNLGLWWFPFWHYSVVIGYDLPAGTVIQHSGGTPRRKISLRVFKNTWARSAYWGLLVLPPSRLPATADEEAYISSVVGLEKARQWGAAAEGYQAALARWPESPYVRIGLGNSRHALGDFESAERAFREATERFPTNGLALNNLAQALLDQGKTQEALDAALKAVSTGGPLAAEYQKTLEEILERKR